MDDQSAALFTLDGKEHVVKEITWRNKRSRNDKTKENDLPPFPEEKDYKSMYKKAKMDLFFLNLDYDAVLDGYCNVCKKKDELNDELEKLEDKIKTLSASISVRLK